MNTYPQPNDWHVEPDPSGFRVVVKQKPATGKEDGMEAKQDAHVHQAVAHRLHSTADYAAYNYGAKSAITRACAAGDARAFMGCTGFVTQDIDIKLSNLQDYIAFRLPRAAWEG